MCTRAATTMLRQCPLALNDEIPAEPQTDSSVCCSTAPTMAPLVPSCSPAPSGAGSAFTELEISRP